MKDYTYINARVRTLEASLMTEQELEQLIAAKDYEEAKRLAADRSNNSSEGIKELLSGIDDERYISLFLLPVDYHNIRASVKAVFADTDAEDFLLDGGLIDKYVIYDAVKTDSYGRLPENMGRTASDARSLILHTQDGHLADLLIDKAELAAEENAARGDKFLERYVAMKADLSNLKTASRCAALNRSRSFIEAAVYRGGTLNISSLISAAEKGTEALAEFTEGTEYREGAETIKNNPALFEKWCDDCITEFMQQAKYEFFSIAPVAAYIHAKRTEESAVRLILAAKHSRIDNNTIRERVRRLYV